MDIRYKPLINNKTEKIIRNSLASEIFKKESLWHYQNPKKITSLNLVSLDRIGGNLGFGGSKVFFGALRARKSDNQYFYSEPVVLKISDNNIKKSSELIESWNNYKKIRGKVNEDTLAKPLLLFPTDDNANFSTRILWSELAIDEPFTGVPLKTPLELKDYIEASDWVNTNRSLDALYQSLKVAHEGHIPIRDGDIFDHYVKEGYLHLDKNWLEKYLTYFSTNEKINVFGKSVTNPFIFLKNILDNKFKSRTNFYCSTVHGDLHPRNVIVGLVHTAKLIDFEKSSDNFHTMVDYSLMETSLKFFHLTDSLQYDELIQFENSLLQCHKNTNITFNSSILDNTYQCIQSLRNKAKPHIHGKWNNTNFEKQYLIPLFINTMGTFGFADKVKNFGHLLLSAGLICERITGYFE